MPGSCPETKVFEFFLKESSFTSSCSFVSFDFVFIAYNHSVNKLCKSNMLNTCNQLILYVQWYTISINCIA